MSQRQLATGPGPGSETEIKTESGSAEAGHDAAAPKAQMDALDAIAARFADRGGQPGLAYGVVAGGALVHSAGYGECWLDGPVPDAGTVFRIASMTKSFTASMILTLRDSGALRLDDPAQDYVPELRGIELPGSDCVPPTIRQLLTMTAGFPTDDPWGDRQQGLAPDDFARLLADGGLRFAWAPGTRFEYSNLGYAVLGKVIEAATGLNYADAVRASLFSPLSLHWTGFEAAEFDQAQLARGYRRDDALGWLELEPDPHGAFAPMGGIFSCVRDLAGWVAGFAAAFPVRDSPADDHPLSRASRREMQLAQVAILPGGAPVLQLSGPVCFSYGLGLFVEEDPAFGSIVHHSGGYPGFGSHMRWHLASGSGVVVLANSTYAGAQALGAELLAALLAAQAKAERAPYLLRGPAPASMAPWQQTVTARDAINNLVQDWDDSLASQLFTANVDLDRPFDQRRADIAKLRERIGPFEPDPDRAAECDSPAHCRWWLTGEGGSACIQIRLAPLREPLVQQLSLAVPPAAGSGLQHAVSTLITAMNAGEDGWPAGLRTAASVDTEALMRQLRIAAVWAGHCRLDGYVAGDGETATTVRLAGETGKVILSVAASGSGAPVQQISVSLLL